MGVRSFRSGKGQKRQATEGGINKGHAEPFLSTRRTGLASHLKDRPPAAIPEQFYIKFKWHMYGNQMGYLRVYWVDENDKNYAVSSANWPNYQLSVDWLSNGNYSTLKSGQQQTTATSAYITAKTETITFNGNDGFIFFGGVIGSGYRSDMAIDVVEFYDASDDSLFAYIPETTDNWLTNTTNNLDAFTSSPAEMQNIVQATGAGRWNLDFNATASSSTGPNDDAGGDEIWYMYTEASGATGKYCSLRSVELLEEYLLP